MVHQLRELLAARAERQRNRIGSWKGAGMYSPQPWAEDAFRGHGNRLCQGRVITTQAWEVPGTMTEGVVAKGPRAARLPRYRSGAVGWPGGSGRCTQV